MHFIYNDGDHDTLDDHDGDDDGAGDDDDGNDDSSVTLQLIQLFELYLNTITVLVLLTQQPTNINLN